MIQQNFLVSAEPLQAGNAVAAILLLEDDRYVMQLRDDRPDIWYPGHWGLFGGGVDSGEDRTEALRRELREELELDVAVATPFACFTFDLTPMGLSSYYRAYYEICLTPRQWETAVLGEGMDMRAMSSDEALTLTEVSPYDAFALFLHSRRRRLVAAAPAV